MVKQTQFKVTQSERGIRRVMNEIAGYDRTANHTFCSCYASKEFSSSRHIWNTALFECERFVAVPSLGSLVAGWLLVVPRTEVLCLGELSHQDRTYLRDFVREVVQILEEQFGPVAAFEHGPAKKDSAVSCGVNYAHLHLVPTDCDLRLQASLLAPQIEWQQASGICDTEAFFRQGKPYI